MAKKKLKEAWGDIPLGVKLTSLLMVTLGVVALWYTITAFGGSSSSDTESTQLTNSETSTVNIGAKNATGYQVGGDSVVDEKSPIAQAEKEARINEISQAKTEPGGGYMKPLEIKSRPSEESQKSADFLDNLMAEVNNNAGDKIEDQRSRQDVPSGLDDTIDQDRKAQGRLNKLQTMESSLARSQNQGQSQGGVAVTKVRAYQSFQSQENGFMDGERKMLDEVADGADRMVSRIKSNEGASYGGGSGSGGGAPEGSPSGASPSGSNDPYSPDFYRPYTENSRALDVKPDYAGLNETRNSVAASVGQGGGPGVQRQPSPQQSRSQGNQGNQTSGSGMPQEPSRPYKALGDICYGKLKMPVNSDVPTPVRVQMLDRRCNDIFGSIAVAAPARTGEYVQMELRGINVDGRTMPIDAIVLDPATDSPLFQDSLDRHIFHRYISLATAAALPGWQEAVTGEEREEEDNGDVRRTQPPVEALSDQIAVVAGSIGEALVPIFQDNFRRPPTVKVFNNRDVLIMFMGDFTLR